MVFVQKLTAQELVGQLFLARYDESRAIEDIGNYHLGGYVLFSRDFASSSPEDIQSKTNSCQAASRLPMLIAIDEEGGSVVRVSGHSQFRSSPFPSPRTLYNTGGIDLIVETEIEKCRLLKSLGINVNLAPVCDITTDPNAFMYPRSLGQSPAITGAFAADVCAVMAQERIGSVLKHFPGYGNNVDTHIGIAVDKRSLEELEAQDLLPFRAGIAAGCGGILASHTIVEAIDPTTPASLSPKAIRYLRRNLGFSGVIITDDLIMEAITDTYGTGEAAVLAILAGCDLLCSTDYEIQYSAVLDAVNTGRIPIEQLRQSAARILQWKHDLGLFPQ